MTFKNNNIMEEVFIILAIVMVVAIYIAVRPVNKKKKEREPASAIKHEMEDETRGMTWKGLSFVFVAMLFVQFIITVSSHGVTPNVGDAILSLVEALGFVLPCFALPFLISLIYRLFAGSYYSKKTIAVYSIVIYLIGVIGSFV